MCPAAPACLFAVFTFLIGQVFLSILCAMKWGTFLFFAGGWCAQHRARLHAAGARNDKQASSLPLALSPARAGFVLIMTIFVILAVPETTVCMAAIVARLLHVCHALKLLN